MGKLTLILGGARSGKSALAEQIARESEASVTYIATAQALDEEMRARIQVHRTKRPKDWRTFEIPRDIAKHWREERTRAQTVILDCLTLLVTNLVVAASPDADHPDETAATKLVQNETEDLLALIEETEAHWILVSNEVGLGLVPPYPLGRLYRDLLGFTNQRVASQAGEVYWMVAGIPVPIHHLRLSNQPGPYGR
jgi:adenosylcobinamide kinase/adenosylcobinamide-phosphate guanylyltransferase